MSEEIQNTSANQAIEHDPLATFLVDAAAVDKAAGVAQEPIIDNDSGAADAPEQEPEVIEPAMLPEDEAGAIVGILTSSITAIYPVLDYHDDIKAKAAQKLAPLIKKYGVGGSLLAKWEAEIEAGLFFGAMAYQSILLVRADKAAKAEEPVKPSRFANFTKWFKRK